MASSGQPLGIGLSVDFSRLDADLSKVADRIDKVGSETTLKVGTLSGMSSGSNNGLEKMAGQVAMIGADLSRGIATGVQSSSALLLSFAARISATLDKLAGVTISLFTRIDAAMRFPRFDAFLARADVGLTKLWKGSTKEITALDVAMAGGFGKMAQHAAKIFNVMFADLGKLISEPMVKGLEQIKTATASIAPAILDMTEKVTKAISKMAYEMAVATTKSAEMMKGSFKGITVAATTAGEATANNFMWAYENGIRRQAKSLIATAKDQLAIDKMVKKQSKSEDSTISLGSKTGKEGTAAGVRLRLAAEKALESKPIVIPLIGGLPTDFPPPTKASVEKFVGSFARMAKERTSKMQKELFEGVTPQKPKNPFEFDMKAWTLKNKMVLPDFLKQPKSPPAPKTLPKQDVFEMAGSAAKQSWQAVTNGISTARQKLAEFSKAGFTIDQILTKIAGSFGGWGIAIAVPLGTLITLGEVVVRTSSFFIDMGVRAVRALNWIHNLITSIGGIGNKTFKELFVSHGLFLGGLLVSIKVLKSFTVDLFNLATFGIFKRAKNDVDSLNASVKAGEPIMGKLGRTVASLGSQMIAAFGMVGLVYKVVELFKSGVKSATELNATVAQSKATFGESFGTVAEQAEKNAKAFHVSKGAQLELASAFGGMAQGAGIAEDKSAALANELTQLAVDAAGVGISMSEIGEAMKTGLSGRAISLKQFAVNIDENTTKAYAWKTGIAKAGQELTMQQTLMARAGQVMRGLDYVSGSLTKGVSQAGVQFKMAGGGVALFAEKIGEILLPGLKAAAVGFNELMGGALDLLQVGGPAIQEWSNAGAGFVMDFIKMIKEFGPAVVTNMTWAWGEAKKGPLGFVIDGTEKVIGFVKFIPEAIGIAVRNAGTIWEIAKVEVGTFVDNAIAYFNTIPANFQIMFPWLQRNWKNILVDIGNMINAFMDNIGKNIKNLANGIWDWLNGKEFKFEFTPLLEGFAATTEKLPDLIKPPIKDASEEVGKLWDKIKANEIKRPGFKGEGEGPASVKQKPILPEDKGKEYKLGGALEAGTKEAFSAIAKGQSGRSTTTDAVKQGITVQKDILKVQKEHLEVSKKQSSMPFEVK